MRARVKILLTPLGNKIKYEIKGRIFCSRMNKALPNSRTLGKKDLVWKNVFESKNSIDKFLKRNKQRSKIISLYFLGYEECDQIFTFRLTK
jgi:hypothetical protein